MGVEGSEWEAGDCEHCGISTSLSSEGVRGRTERSKARERLRQCGPRMVVGGGGKGREQAFRRHWGPEIVENWGRATRLGDEAGEGGVTWEGLFGAARRR
jgi:hypothetical protein